MDYRSLGLKVGIEIHQRLNTKKLFCSCSSNQENKEYWQVTRKLRPVAGELGVVDPAAMHEQLRDKTFVYKLFPNETCLVEADDEPPHEINSKALEIVVQICKLFNASVMDEVHVMRKTVIDGSNTGGFQRTMVVGMDGCIDTSFGRVRIDNVALEEEAARIEKQTEHETIYRLNGMAIPLVEIGTEPKAGTPDEALELAYKIGTALRTTNIQRGIGSIRQDVNVSIRAGSRVEIKGFQEIKKLPELIENEIHRQLALLEIKQHLERRKFHPDTVVESKDVTPIFAQTKCNFIRKIVDGGGFVYAIHLPKFGGLLVEKCGGNTFGKELSYYAQPLEGMIHTDEDLHKYSLEHEFEKMKNMFNHSRDDLVAIVSGHDKDVVKKSAHAVIMRARHCLHGVPEETRIALVDSTSRFARPLPGSGRMYPETDIPSVVLSRTYVEKIQKPETLAERKAVLDRLLPPELANQIIVSEYYDTFKSIAGQDPVLIATTLLSTMKDLKRSNVDVSRITRQQLQKVFDLVGKNKIPKSSVPKIIESVAKGSHFNDVVDKFEHISDVELEKLAEKIIASSHVRKVSVLMGQLMKEAKGRVSGETAAKVIEKKLKEKK